MTIRELINNNDYKGIQEALSANPGLANEGIPYDEHNTTKAHPLHRIADGVLTGKFTDAEAVAMAKLFLEQGADIYHTAVITATPCIGPPGAEGRWLPPGCWRRH